MAVVASISIGTAAGGLDQKKNTTTFRACMTIRGPADFTRLASGTVIHARAERVAEAPSPDLVLVLVQFIN